jgi:hypothetical protein
MSYSEEPHICQECGQAFDTIESLKEHQQAERQEKILRSEEIEIDLSSYAALNRLQK